MTQLSPRAVLPATLVFLGIALACSLACYNGPSPTAAEFDEMKSHTLLGAEILSDGRTRVMRLAEEIAQDVFLELDRNLGKIESAAHA